MLIIMSDFCAQEIYKRVARDSTGLIRQFVSCACGKYRRLKHRGSTCDCCHTMVSTDNYDFIYFFVEWLKKIRVWMVTH